MLRKRTATPNKRMLVEFQKLDTILKQTPIELIPFSKEELGLLSFHQDQKKNSGWINKVSTGVITSIYQEYVAQYIFRNYYFAAISSVLYIKTESHKFGYIFGKKKCDLYINDQYAGSLSKKGELTGPRGRRILMRLHQQFDKSIAIKILDKETALMNHLKKDDLSISRMLAWEDTQSIEELLLIMAVCFLRNIMTAIEHPSMSGYLRT